MRKGRHNTAQRSSTKLWSCRTTSEETGRRQRYRQDVCFRRAAGWNSHRWAVPLRVEVALPSPVVEAQPCQQLCPAVRDS